MIELSALNIAALAIANLRKLLECLQTPAD